MKGRINVSAPQLQKQTELMTVIIILKLSLPEFISREIHIEHIVSSLYSVAFYRILFPITLRLKEIKKHVKIIKIFW